ncbi:flagellar filament capping protein FliD [Vibrio sp.]|nr:flagellar filament capping protein FliD [Vibrio sp.]
MQIDAEGLARNLALYEIQPFELIANRKINELNAKKSAINELKSQISSLTSTIAELSSSDTSLSQQSVTQSSDEYFSVSTSNSSTDTQFSVFVEQLATSHQLSSEITIGDASTLVDATGIISISNGNTSFDIDLSSLDSDNDNFVTITEILSEINSHTDNDGVISASVVQAGGGQHLWFSADSSGAEGQLSITTTSTSADVSTLFDSSGAVTRTAAQDAIAWLGGEVNVGLQVTSSSNTLSGVFDGVDITVNKANTTGDTLTQVSIAADSDATKEQVSTFVDAYNSLLNTLDGYTRSGGEDESRGVLASSAYRSIESSLRSIMQGEFSGESLYNVGIQYTREGVLEIDSNKLSDFIDSSNVTLDDVFSGDDGVFSQIENYLELYTDFSDGLFTTQLSSIEALTDRQNDRIDTLEQRYEAVYERYLRQFSQLNNLSSQMDSVSSLFNSF